MGRRMSLMATTMIVAALVAPSSAVARPPKHLNSDGSVPAQWNLPKPRQAPHADEAPASAGGNGDGSNTLSFTAFDDGDMAVVMGTAAGHCGEWDNYYWRGSLYDRCFWSANKSPADGVQREAPAKYRQYDYAYGIWVPSLSATRRVSARTYCRYQSGEPYDIASSKSNQSSWYCSKLLWASYRYTSAIDLDADGGYWVWPIDLVSDSQTSVFASAR